MKTIFCFLFFPVCFDGFAQTPGCLYTASTQKANQHRSAAKHVTSYDDFILKEDTITVNYINKWEKKYKSKTKTIKQPREMQPVNGNVMRPGDALYILKGFMWFVKQEENDCDLHIEIGPENVFLFAILFSNEYGREHLLIR